MTGKGAKSRALAARVGPADDGRPMSLRRFARADAVPGYRYELSRGVIQVGEFPALSHGQVVSNLCEAIAVYEDRHPVVITFAGRAGMSKIELWGRESERHPDFSIYLTPPPAGVEQPWDRWMPEIVVEVVSASSTERDYEEKPDDYLAAGVKEYWIIDPVKKGGLFLTRRGDSWLKKRVGRRGVWTTRLLPKFKLDLGRVFERATKRK